jgi:hypothetical protein
MADRKQQDSKKTKTKETEQPLPSRDAAEGDLETIEEDLRAHEKNGKRDSENR